jgi:hypothetical protein
MAKTNALAKTKAIVQVASNFQANSENTYLGGRGPKQRDAQSYSKKFRNYLSPSTCFPSIGLKHCCSRV